MKKYTTNFPIIQITGLHNLTITEPLRAYINEKIEKLKKHFDHITEIHFTLSEEKVNRRIQHAAKGHIVLPQNSDIIGTITSDDMYASVDMLMDVLDRQLKDHKNKMKKRVDSMTSALRHK